MSIEKEKQPLKMLDVAKHQLTALFSKSMSEQLGTAIAGIKDGRYYTLSGVDFGKVEDASTMDVEFFNEEDLKGRITSVKIKKLIARIDEFIVSDNKKVEESNVEEPKVEEPKVEEPKVEEPKVEEPNINLDAVEKKCKQAIKDGDVKKATKLLVKLENEDCFKKLAKKLAKLKD